MDQITMMDGAMGTLLQAQGLQQGRYPELICLRQPEAVAAVHRAYLQAGSRILYANTFGANPLKLKGSGCSVEEVIAAAVGIARAEAGSRARVALDIGPLGELMEPMGSLSFDAAYDCFAQMIAAGASAGADLVVFETFSDLAEARAGLLAARETSSLPVCVTMTFDETGRTLSGCTPAAAAMALTALGASILGVNCSQGPGELVGIVREMARYTSLPLAAKPNAGLPDPQTGAYSLDPVGFARQMVQFVEAGATYLGGCCGTTPQHIRALASATAQLTPPPRPAPRAGLCSAGRVVELDGVRVIGERINPTGKKRFQRALRLGQMDYIASQALEQAHAGADILDINVGLPGLDEPKVMEQTVRAVQAAVDLPLQIDSSDPAAIEAGLRAFHGKAIVNSVNAEPEKLKAVLPLVKKYGAAVVGLTMDDSGLPRTADERLRLASVILDAALSLGIPRQDVYIDCLTLTASAEQAQAAHTLEAVRRVRGELGLHTVLGVSNISFGLPAREQLSAAFLTAAMAAGLDLPIINPNSREMMDAVAAWRVLSGEDTGCAGYVARFAGTASATSPAPAAKPSLKEAIYSGLRDEAVTLTEALCSQLDELAVVETELIPALDEVGARYERQEIFLPQLLRSANAAGAAFDAVRARMKARGAAGVSKGEIVLATVHGDIHDIGKNIVKTVLENYGYTVIDLGRDVPPERVVEAAAAHKVKLVGLSALMTTTVPAMAQTIEALRASGLGCKVMVGGAVLTPEYAARIGADFYSADAKQAVDIARRVLGE